MNTMTMNSYEDLLGKIFEAPGAGERAYMLVYINEQDKIAYGAELNAMSNRNAPDLLTDLYIEDIFGCDFLETKFPMKLTVFDSWNEFLYFSKPKHSVADNLQLKYFTERMKSLQGYYNDHEVAHETADNLLCLFLQDLGYTDLVNEYIKIEKWYG